MEGADMYIRKIGMISRTYHHIQRYRQILTILFKYGFEDLIDTLKIEQYLEIGFQMISRKRREKIETLSRAERVRMTLEELGPTFVKMGQILSTRPDLLPLEFLQQLSRLQDDVPAFPFELVKESVEKELGASVGSLFQEFEEIPLASASIGQVHKARLINGDPVIVKVQRPNITKTIEVDLEIMLHLASLMEKHLKAMEIHRPTRVVEEFTRTLEMELDYTLEAAHAERFAAQFLGEHYLYVPKVYREVTTRRILTMEYIDGIKASELEKLEKAGLDTRKIARRGFNLILKQIFTHGFFHADPHPGNVFILPNNIICFLDFGMMGRIGRQARENFADLIMGIVQRDETKTTRSLIALTIPDEKTDPSALERDVAQFIDRYFYRPLKELEMGKLLQNLVEMTSKHRLRIPPDLFLMLKALATEESVGKMLDPDFDAIRQAAPFIKRIQLERLHPKRMAGDILDSGSEFLHLLKEIPSEVREILRQARQGRIKIEFEHRGLEPMLSTHDRVSNRIAFAIILAALIIGSSLIVLSGVPPKWHEIPIIGLAGFVIAAIMGFWLLISIIRRGRM
jgi:ubiquinone biosynthesis protein